jgi:hypothetical protein
VPARERSAPVPDTPHIHDRGGIAHSLALETRGVPLVGPARQNHAPGGLECHTFPAASHPGTAAEIEHFAGWRTAFDDPLAVERIERPWLKGMADRGWAASALITVDEVTGS